MPRRHTKTDLDVFPTVRVGDLGAGKKDAQGVMARRAGNQSEAVGEPIAAAECGMRRDPTRVTAITERHKSVYPAAARTRAHIAAWPASASSREA